ncbi:ABC transporter substrate-binding protein [Trueperella sp. LYQ141]|uniref:ABC transporter substrate-binding protein n=1 Tax=Trueperella sp. LYQ141 TaxID=3391058 RepID=UPI003982E40C
MKKIAALLSVCTLLVGCSATAHQAGEQNPSEAHSASGSSEGAFTIGLTYIPDVQFAPMYIAHDKGFFADEGLDITLRHHGAQEALFGAMSNGEEDIVFAGGDEMLQAASTGIDVVNWATMYQRYPVVLITRQDSPIHSPADLAGHSVGLPGPYGENYYGLLAMMQSYSLANVDVQYIGYTQAAALASGQVDAIIGFTNNDAVVMRDSGMDIREIPLVAGDLPLVGVGLGSPRDAINPVAFAKILHALQKACEYASEHRDEALDIVAHYVPSLRDPAQRARAGQVLDATLALYTGSSVFGSQNTATWEAMAQFLKQSKVIDRVPDLPAYTTAVLDQWAGGK